MMYLTCMPRFRWLLVQVLLRPGPAQDPPLAPHLPGHGQCAGERGLHLDLQDRKRLRRGGDPHGMSQQGGNEEGSQLGGEDLMGYGVSQQGGR